MFYRDYGFTLKFSVQFKIQRRQVRVNHPDCHYFAALFKYFRSRAVEARTESTILFCDDKANIPGGRARVFCLNRSERALDDDMHKASITPNVVLECNVPKAIDKSFVRVTISVSDSVFQASDPFRHAAMICNILREKEHVRY